ncbi:zf-HC2 domain-containing protein [Sulfurivermis fontis]|uniref:zf-HC2 domain-containing protein n=1 Tax=Sulfurivermis fontis TaxID=1972068 RepID=UPI000FD755DA|nr:zf-HC2 domain-containing protein [Sulfurivermis fontis]
MLTCKHATKLMSQAQDRPLTLRERIGLRLHLMMCSGCTQFERQLHFIRTACRRIGGG